MNATEDGQLDMKLKATLNKPRKKSMQKVESKIVIKPLTVDDSGFIFEEDDEIIEHNNVSEVSPMVTMANVRRNSLDDSI
jgi:hypothetical protein